VAHKEEHTPPSARRDSTGPATCLQATDDEFLTRLCATPNLSHVALSILRHGSKRRKAVKPQRSRMTISDAARSSFEETFARQPVFCNAHSCERTALWLPSTRWGQVAATRHSGRDTHYVSLRQDARTLPMSRCLGSTNSAAAALRCERAGIGLFFQLLEQQLVVESCGTFGREC